MISKNTFDRDKSKIAKGAVTGIIIGGLLGAAAVLFEAAEIFSIPLIASALAVNPSVAPLTVIALGALVGGSIGSLTGSYNARDIAYEDTSRRNTKEVSGATLELREEQLDIYKNLIKTGEVRVHKEISTEEKLITVPINREELVVEKIQLSDDASSNAGENVETIRIPVKEERIEVIKHDVILNDIDIHRDKHEEMQSVVENIKKEKLNVKVTGDAKVIDIDTKKRSNR